MVESTEEKIERFREFYDQLINTASNEGNKCHQKIHSKILYCSILDSLSKSIFPNIEGNGDRFKSLIREIPSWRQSQYISLLHIVRFFEINKNIDKIFEDLKHYCSTEFEKRFQLKKRLIKNHISLDFDIDFDEINKIWPKDKNKTSLKLQNISIMKFKHENLIWLYRNAVTHEYRNPGRGVESISRHEPEPYYQEIATVTGFTENCVTHTNKWELIYPSDFFERLSREALTCVCTKHREENTSPFSSFSEGSYWMPELNI